ncbi:MAG: DUF4062 domain-containing protein [Sphingobacteriaceae bacterium]|nr:DUF4062 domain-containing protein [Sphingobacteriaceae bacterium]
MIKYGKFNNVRMINMARPRIFVSSTYYDLKYIRNSLEQFINSFGYEPVLFENGDIPFTPNKSLESSCYQEINSANMLILIIGGKFGAKSEENIEHVISKHTLDLNSITMKEYIAAYERSIPIFVFVDSQVMSEFETYKKNKDKSIDIEYAHVNHVNIFKLIEDIRSRRTSGMFTKTFDKFDDIASWLKEQWAGMFTEYLKQLRDSSDAKKITSKIDDLDTMINRLTTYNDAILKRLMPGDYEQIIHEADNSEAMQRLFSNDLGKWILKQAIMFSGFGIDATEEQKLEVQHEVFRLFIKSSNAKYFWDNVMIDPFEKERIFRQFPVEFSQDFREAKEAFDDLHVYLPN